MRFKILAITIFSSMILMGASCQNRVENKPILPTPPVATSSEPLTTEVVSEPLAPIRAEKTITESKEVIFDIVADSFNFSPNVLTVRKGDAVKINFLSKDVTHGLSIPEYKVNILSPVGEVVSTSFIADKVGTFNFRCSVYCGEGHTGMTGTLVVQE